MRRSANNLAPFARSLVWLVLGCSGGATPSAPRTVPPKAPVAVSPVHADEADQEAEPAAPAENSAPSSNDEPELVEDEGEESAPAPLEPALADGDDWQEF